MYDVIIHNFFLFANIFGYTISSVPVYRNKSLKEEEIVISQNKPYSKKVILRHHIFTLDANFRLTLKQTATELKLSYRQTRRLFKRFIEGGRNITSLVSKRVAWNKLKKDDYKKVIQLSMDYPDLNNCHLPDIFEEETGKKISHNTVRNIHIEENLYKPNLKKRKPHKRFEMQAFGQLVQLDTSEHPWIPTIEKELALICTDNVFCFKWQRTVKNDNTFQFGNKTYQLTKFIPKRSYPYGKIMVHIIPGKSLRVFCNEQFVQQFPYRKEV